MPSAARNAKPRARATRPQPDAGRVQRAVLDWFDEHARPFPWREHRDPYATMVAEVMLQQTQTGRVAPSYTSFLEHFPTIERLAHAPAMDVIRAWKGLGYNRRAVDLQRAAQVIVGEHGGAFPSDPAVLRTLPGIGGYSSAAIACFAFDAQIPVIDVNVRRVLSRAGLGLDGEEATPKDVADIAKQWLPDGEAYRWNQALMDVGAMICRPAAPLCGSCPLRRACAYKAAGRHREAREPKAAKEPFAGSNRQKRGGIVDKLRDAAHDGVTLSALARAIDPDRGRDLTWLVELLDGLEADGLVELSPAARRGSPRGSVRLPG